MRELSELRAPEDGHSRQQVQSHWHSCWECRAAGGGIALRFSPVRFASSGWFSAAEEAVVAEAAELGVAAVEVAAVEVAAVEVAAEDRYRARLAYQAQTPRYPPARSSR
jgi:hypothetical protein